MNPNEILKLQLPSCVIEQDFIDFLLDKRKKDLCQLSAGEEMMKDLLSLPRPRIQKPVQEYLSQEGILEAFLQQVTLGNTPTIELQETERQRPKETSKTIQAFKIMQLLGTQSVHSKLLFVKNETRFIVSLMQIFDPQSSGSL